MNFDLTSDQETFRDAVRGFAERHLREGALARAHAPDHPWDVAKLMAEQGLLGITIPEKVGGQGGTLMDAVIAIETVAQVCPRSADVVQAGNFGAIRVLAEYGTDDQKARYLKRLLSGEGVICVGMTEPEAGSAVTDLKTTATPDGDGFRVTGEKVFTTHAPYADVMVVYVRYGPGVNGIGSVLIPIKAEGVKQGKPSYFVNGEEWVTTWFDNVYVPAENVLLREGGFRKQIAGFNVERIGNTARSLALGRYCYETARQWALQRKQFGRLLAEFQGLQWKFADMKVKLDAGECGSRHALGRRDRHCESLLQSGRLRDCVRSDAGDGRHGLHARHPRRVVLSQVPWLDDRRRFDRDPQEPHRGRRLRAHVLAASAQVQ
jgi:alkylation response protein AidB-like acyl-CoA dehydrogenase